jgi:hypothetical protein
MSVILGVDEFRYEVLADWSKLPSKIVLGEVGGIGVDSKDRIYVFNRGDHPMIVFDRDGNFLRSWGQSVFKRPHAVHVGPDDALYCTDDGDHTVRKCTTDGEVLLTLGVPGKPSPYMSGEPFHRCTHTALAPDNSIYVSDGYGNARVHRYSPEGKLLTSWGSSGTGPGEFNIPHNICCDPDGWVYVADRESHRIQVFDGNGRYETEWHNLHRPCAMCLSPGRCPCCYVGELGPGMNVNKNAPNLGPRVSIFSTSGALLARLGGTTAGTELGQFIAPHGIAVDSRGDIYVGEVAKTTWQLRYPDKPPPSDLRYLRKLVHLPKSTQGE